MLLCRIRAAGPRVDYHYVSYGALLVNHGGFAYINFKETSIYLGTRILTFYCAVGFRIGPAHEADHKIVLPLCSLRK